MLGCIGVRPPPVLKAPDRAENAISSNVARIFIGQRRPWSRSRPVGPRGRMDLLFPGKCGGNAFFGKYDENTRDCRCLLCQEYISTEIKTAVDDGDFVFARRFEAPNAQNPSGGNGVEDVAMLDGSSRIRKVATRNKGGCRARPGATRGPPAVESESIRGGPGPPRDRLTLNLSQRTRG